jgi:hypothetical protein
MAKMPTRNNADIFAQLSEIYKRQEKNRMLHLAIKIPEGWGYNELATSIDRMVPPHGGHPMIADTSASALKEKVRDAIRRDPDARYLMLSGNTVAEMSAPPVTFRQW